MDVGEEVDSKKKLDQRKSCRSNCEESMNSHVDVLKEQWQQELQRAKTK